MALNKELVSLESERYVGVARAPDANDVDAVLGSVVKRLSSESLANAAPSENVEKGATEMNTERNFVVPFRDPCPISLTSGGLRLRFLTRKTPCRVHCGSNVRG